MATKHDLQGWLVTALRAHGGKAGIVGVCKYVWKPYESHLRQSGDLFYTWQDDIRWAAHQLRKARMMRPAKDAPGIWELAKKQATAVAAGHVPPEVACATSAAVESGTRCDATGRQADLPTAQAPGRLSTLVSYAPELQCR